MILPYSHENLSAKRMPWITIGIITLNVLVFLGTWIVIREEQKEILAKAKKVDQYYRQHPYLKLNDYILKRLPARKREQKTKEQEEINKLKEEFDKIYQANKERQADRNRKTLEDGQKNLLQLKEKRLAARTSRNRDYYEKEIERVEKQLEKYKEIEETGGSGKSPTAAIETEQTELDRLMQDLQQTMEKRLFNRYGLVPSNIEWWAFFTSIFLHADWWHLIGNMLLLWIMGCNI